MGLRPKESVETTILPEAAWDKWSSFWSTNNVQRAVKSRDRAAQNETFYRLSWFSFGFERVLSGK